MRLLELRTDSSGAPTLEFHPNLTVVYGLGPAGREAVIDVVRALPAGDTAGYAGLLEAHGMLFDLDRETLDAFGLDESIDVVVRAEDLPGRPEEPMASVTPLFGDTGKPSPDDDGSAGPSADAVAAAEAAVAKAEASFEDAEEAHRVMAEATERAKLERAAAIEAAQRIQAALDKARRDRDIARAERDGKLDESLAGSDGEARARARVEELEARHQQLTEDIHEFEEQDPRPIQVLMDALRQPVQSDRLVPSQEAIALADEFAELQNQLDDLERRLEADGLSMDQLSQRLEDARFEVTQAERGMSKPEASDQDITELEAVHEQVLEAERRASGRVGRKAALKKLEEVKAREQEILDRIGFPTWASYVMGSTLMNIDPMAEQRLEQARAELNAAEEAWAQLTAQLEADPDYAGLLDRLEAVFLAAFDILGGETEGDLEERLRNHLVPDEEISREDILEALVYQLSLRDVEVDEGAAAVVIMGVADEWLAATTDHWEKYNALQEQAAQTAGELEAARREVTRREADVDEVTPEQRQRRFEEAESRVADILTDLEGVNAIVSDLDAQVEAREMLAMPSVTALEAARGRLDEARAALTALAPAGSLLPPSADRDPGILGDLPYSEDGEDDGATGRDAEATISYLVERVAALRNRSHAGSVPLVVDEPMAGRPAGEIAEVLDVLERMAESVQVVYLSDDDGIVEWADRVGLQRAAAVTPQGAFG
jgi:hypothetical protein